MLFLLPFVGAAVAAATTTTTVGTATTLALAGAAFVGAAKGAEVALDGTKCSQGNVDYDKDTEIV